MHYSIRSFNQAPPPSPSRSRHMFSRSAFTTRRHAMLCLTPTPPRRHLSHATRNLRPACKAKAQALSSTFIYVATPPIAAHKRDAQLTVRLTRVFESIYTLKASTPPYVSIQVHTVLFVPGSTWIVIILNQGGNCHATRRAAYGDETYSGMLTKTPPASAPSC